jgi:hypothetical protein
VRWFHAFVIPTLFGNGKGERNETLFVFCANGFVDPAGVPVRFYRFKSAQKIWN